MNPNYARDRNEHFIHELANSAISGDPNVCGAFIGRYLAFPIPHRWRASAPMLGDPPAPIPLDGKVDMVAIRCLPQTQQHAALIEEARSQFRASGLDVADG